MDQLVITENHTLYYLPSTIRLKRYKVLEYFRLGLMSDEKFFLLIEELVKDVEQEVDLVLSQMCKSIESIDNEIDYNHYYSAVYPSYDLLKPVIKPLIDITKKKIIVDKNRFLRLVKWELSLYQKIESTLRNVKPAAFQEKKESPDVVVKNFIEPSKVDVINKVETPQVTIKNPTKFVKKEDDYDYCFELYTKDPELYHQRVTDRIIENSDTYKSGKELMIECIDLGIVDHLQKHPRFKGNNTELARFFQKLNNYANSKESFRRPLYK